MKMLEYNGEIDPFFIFKKLSSDYSVLLESSIQGPKYGRYSFVFLTPREIFVLDDDGDVLKYLDTLDWVLNNTKNTSDFIFSGGLAGFLSYNFGVDLHGVKRRPDSSFVPKAYFGYFEDFVVIDHLEKKTFAHFSSKILKEEFDFIANTFDHSKVYTCFAELEKIKVDKAWSNFSKSEYMQAVSQIRRYILEGDVYQVNLSQRFYAEGYFDSDSLYCLLRKKNFGFYHAYIKLPNARIISTSPELFLQRRGDMLTTKPIKGTARRGKDQKEDEALKNELFSSTKCRSELLMIVDLERNDFAKICLPESIEVEKLFDIEEYSTVFHLVSTIKGKVMPRITFKDIIEATFPGGSITGAPKLSAIKIIEELERCPRGLYCGSIGYISNNMNMDFNIAIRTLIIENSLAHFNVGGGIVWDSVEEDEWWETIHKGQPFFEVLGINKLMQF